MDIFHTIPVCQHHFSCQIFKNSFFLVNDHSFILPYCNFLFLVTLTEDKCCTTLNHLFNPLSQSTFWNCPESKQRFPTILSTTQSLLKNAGRIRRSIIPGVNRHTYAFEIFIACEATSTSKREQAKKNRWRTNTSRNKSSTFSTEHDDMERPKQLDFFSLHSIKHSQFQEYLRVLAGPWISSCSMHNFASEKYH